jgi:hypothetical protein
MRKTFLPALLLAGSALAGAGLAWAEGEAAPPPMEQDGGHFHHFMHRHEPGAHIEGRLAFLKTELQIKPAQQKAWDDFSAAAHQSVKVMQDARPQRPDGEKKHDRADWTPPPVPDRLDRAEKIMNARLTALHTVAGPVKALYATLDAAQKKTADELFKGPMGFH